MNLLEFDSSISIQSVYASSTLSGTTVCGATCIISPKLKLTNVSAKTSETCIAYFKSDGTILSGTTTGGGTLSWTGSTANGVGTYVSTSKICSNPNMTFDGTSLVVTGNIKASTFVCSPVITGSTKVCSPIVVGTTYVCSPIVFGTTCICSPITIGSTCVCSPIVFGSTCICSPIIIGSTCLCGPIMLATTCVCSPIIIGSTCLCGPIMLATTCVCSPLLCGTTSANAVKFIENGQCLTLTYLGINATAANSSALCGCVPACFLAVGGTAVCATCAGNASTVAGCTPSCFLAVGGTAVCATCAGNASTVAGCTPSCFLAVGGTAVCATTAGNALCLGGALASCYAPKASPSFTGTICSAGRIDVNSAAGAGGYVSTGNIAGTSTAAFFPTGIYACGGNNNWLYGASLFNTCIVDSLSTKVCINMTNGISCFAGNVTAPDFIATSDCHLKTCIKPITNALSTIIKLQGICYQLCDDEKHENQIGLNAQDTEKILPVVVACSESTEEDKKYGINGYKLGIKYDKLTAILIEAMKEQQLQIKENEKQIRALCLELNYMRNYNTNINTT